MEKIRITEATLKQIVKNTADRIPKKKPIIRITTNNLMQMVADTEKKLFRHDVQRF